MAENESSPQVPQPRAERRLALRVPVRRPVRAAIGLRAFQAELIDLSVTGCKIRCAQPVVAHGSVWIVLPAGFGGRLPLPVRGEVARADSVRGEPTGVCDVALRFRSLTPRAYDRLCAAVAEVLAPPPEPVPEPAAASQPAERRASSRRWFGRRVIARGAGRPRVLLGLDLSAGGMRVERAVGLAAGDELQLALHSHASDVPLVLSARVLRTSATGDAALEFTALSVAQRVALEKILSAVGEGEGVALVSEVLEPAPRLDE